MSDYESTGVLTKDDLRLPTEEHLKKGVAITECVQRIPCNPCVDSCPFDAISMKSLNDPPIVDYDRCTGCGTCVSVCPGLAIFVVKIRGEDGFVTMPYEMIPVPESGERVKVLDRQGEEIGIGEIVRSRVDKNKTGIITVKVKRDLVMDVRNIKIERK